MTSATVLRSFALCAALAAATGLAWASADPQQLTIRDIVAQQTQLRAQAVAGKGVFKGVAKRERDALVQRQDRVLQALGDLETLEEMPPDKRTAVFNDLEWIKAAITKAEDERLVCEHTRVTGSNRMTSVCMTAKQEREYRDASRDVLNRPQMCNGGGCGSD